MWGGGHSTQFKTQYAERIFNRIEKFSIRILQGERAFIRGSKYIVLEILD